MTFRKMFLDIKWGEIRERENENGSDQCIVCDHAVSLYLQGSTCSLSCGCADSNIFGTWSRGRGSRRYCKWFKRISEERLKAIEVAWEIAADRYAMRVEHDDREGPRPVLVGSYLGGPKFRRIWPIEKVASIIEKRKEESCHEA